MKALLSLTIICILLHAQLVFAQWTDIELPTSSGGAVNSICVKGEKIFAGKDEGIYISEDNGLHWRKMNPDLQPRYSLDPNLRLVVATNEFIIITGSDLDVHISKDDGETWIKQGLATSPRTTPDRIAAGGDWIICGETIGYCFNGQSLDGGLTWTEFDSLTSIISAGINDSIALVATSSGLLRSADYGSSWHKVLNISIDLNDPVPIVFFDNTIYMGISSSAEKGYIWTSLDNGLTWEETGYMQCSYINSIIGSPVQSDSQYIFAATDSGVFHSSDKGESWIKKSNGLNSDLIFSLAFKVQGTEGTPMLFAGTGNGIFVSSDYGNNWTETGSPSDWLFNISGSEIYAISSQTTYSGNSRYRFFESDSGFKTVVCHSMDNGSSWDKIYSGYLNGKAKITSFVRNSNGVLFAAGDWYDLYSFIFQCMGSIVFSSDNGGLDWVTIYQDSSTFNPILGAHDADVYMNTVSSFANTGRGLSRFFDNGNSWEKLHPVIEPMVPLDTITKPPINDFSSDGNKIYLAGGSKAVISGRPPKVMIYNLIAFSEDHGQNWTRLESPLDSTTIVEDDEYDTLSVITNIYPIFNHIMVGMQAYNFYNSPWFLSNGGGFYHLYYNGSEWVIADTAFANQSVFTFESNASTIFAGTETGMFSTYDYGKNWNDINNGMGNKCVNNLFVTEDYLIASTTNGVWKRHLSEITSIGKTESNKIFPQEFSLSQNYPNPFNPTTLINYQLPVANDVKLIVYDVLGREVIKLVNQKQKAGRYSVLFNAKNLASGVYIYRLKTGSMERSRKMLLLR
ncbi:MAG: T9SS type A sorting domain-containing protein [Calditrichaceae bacterium]|nr:T9SS type A sorting domain-containing protein [Calditrichaceae bacterium]MBN2710746.1 T9SS type A sorting domain-containing protein [Calditrichaceae bacterium]RQV95698.1 MAG: T9SS C-terminal target domain-containing protein [Calditrichota bacterium]